MRIIITLIILLSVNSVQLLSQNMLLMEVKGESVFTGNKQINPKAAALTSIRNKKISKYGMFKVEKAFPYAPKDSKRSKLGLLTFVNNVDVKGFINDVKNISEFKQIQLYEIPEYKTNCQEITPLPNDLDGTYSNEVLIDFLNGSCAWNIANPTHNIRIAIIDELHNVTHEDIDANIYEYHDFTNRSIAAHGTKMASNASAVTNNNLGVASIGNNCGLLLYNIGTDTNRVSVAQGVNAIDYAVQHSANVISCSWSGSYAWSYLEEAVEDAIEAGVSVLGSSS